VNETVTVPVAAPEMAVTVGAPGVTGAAPADPVKTASPATLSANAAIPRVMVDSDFDIFSPMSLGFEVQVRVGLVAEKFEAAFADPFSLRLPNPDKYFSSVHSRTSPQNFFIDRREQPETWLPTSFYYCFKH
jgi:hypothetical protein